MTSPIGNSEFGFPETLNVPQCKAKGNIEVKRKKNSLFPAGPVIKCFVIPPNLKLEKTAKKVFALRRLANKFGAQPDHVQVESSSCCFPRELVSFVCPRELVSFVSLGSW